METTKRGFVPPKTGFTLVEILVVIAIIGILAAILVPVAGSAVDTAKKRRAQAEMQGIKVAVVQFQNDHRYMPWPGQPKVGMDRWANDGATQAPIMELLTGSNAMKKAYLQIPEKSRDPNNMSELIFVDPWGQPYQIGLDRNLDGEVLVQVVKAHPDDNESSSWNGNKARETVLVYSPGPLKKAGPLKTFDLEP